MKLLEPVQIEPIRIPVQPVAKLSEVRARMLDYLSMTKPRIGLMVMLTVLASAVIALPGVPLSTAVWSAVIGAGLMGAASSVLNQVMEQATDRRMQRTQKRPIAAGRVSGVEGTILGVSLALAGTVVLAFNCNAATTLTTILTMLLYLLAYTPLKQRSTWNTLVGAVPGALPMLIGWLATGRSLDMLAVSLFAILFFWQFPHFFAIAWLYREDYDAGGHVMVTSKHANQRWLGVKTLLYFVGLVLSVAVAFIGLDGGIIFGLISGAVLGFYARASWRFSFDQNHQSARGLLLASLIYLPIQLLSLVVQSLV